MFGKRKGREPVQQPDPTPRRPAPTGAGTLGTVIVRRSTLAKAGEPGNYDLIQGLVNFVNAMTHDGLYSRFEIQQKAMQAYHADFYLAQVLNGGHSQFIHNCFANLPFVIKDVRAALQGMKADSILAIFERAAAWIEANPAEVKQQTGFDGGRAALLDELDTAFYKANDETPMIVSSSLWIKSWPELRAVDDADYVEAIRRVIMLNPLREERLIANSIVNLVTQTIDWFQVGVSLACSSGEKVELKLSIGGGSLMEIEGKHEMAFFVRTNAPQPRYVVVTKEHAAAYEHIDTSHMPALDPADEHLSGDDRIARRRGRSVGRKLSHVKRETIAGVIELSSDYLTAGAIDLLLRRAGIDPHGAAVTARPVEPRAGGPIGNWFVAAGGQVLYVVCHKNGSALLDPTNGKDHGAVRMDEVKAHLDRAAAGRIKAPE